MINPIRIVEWKEKNEMIDDLINHEDTLTTQPMDQGAEAEVMEVCSATESFVLKVWNKDSKPDVSLQYHVLNTLYKRGLPVSEPVGWGINPNGDKVLLTTFDGIPVLNVNKKKMIEIANILSKIHQVKIEKIQVPKHDFLDYFFSGVREHADVYHVLISLVQLIQIKQERLIHGDFHLRNILEKNERYTVIDWTNVQLGDSRYDFAWSLILLKIYVSGRYADVFRSAYLLSNEIPQQDLEVFEALACLRWILLNRSGGVPKEPNTIKRVRGLLTNNLLLKEFEWMLSERE